MKMEEFIRHKWLWEEFATMKYDAYLKKIRENSKKYYAIGKWRIKEAWRKEYKKRYYQEVTKKKKYSLIND